MPSGDKPVTACAVAFFFLSSAVLSCILSGGSVWNRNWIWTGFLIVNHEIVLAKLRFCSLQGTDAHFFTSYLTDGNQRAEIKWSNDT